MFDVDKSDQRTSKKTLIDTGIRVPNRQPRITETTDIVPSESYRSLTYSLICVRKNRGTRTYMYKGIHLKRKGRKKFWNSGLNHTDITLGEGHADWRTESTLSRDDKGHGLVLRNL